MERKIIGFLVLILTLSCESYSQKYKVLFVNSKIQYMENGVVKIAKVGTVFKEPIQIDWKNARQMMRLQNMKTKNKFVVTCQGLQESEAKTIKAYERKYLGTRGAEASSEIGKCKYYLADSIHIPTRGKATGEVAEAVWKAAGKEHVTVIKRTSNGNFYILTNAIFDGQTPENIKLTIRERTGNDWCDNVYKNLSIYYIPKIM